MTDAVWHSYSDDPDKVLLHASAVAWQGRGVLIVGPSGSGKSTLALQAMGLGASLVSDDRVWVEKSEDGLILRAPTQVAGMIEARGIGLLNAAHVPQSALTYCLKLSKVGEHRLPPPDYAPLLGTHVRVWAVREWAGLAAAVIQLLKCGIATDE